MQGIKIISTGSYLPDVSVTNDMFSEFLDTSDEWISTRTGIKTRNFVSSDTTSSMAVKAAKNAVEKSNIDISQIGVLIVATFSPNMATPPLSSIVITELGLPEEIIAFDLNAACTGFLFAFNTARCLLASAPGKYAVVVGSETVSKMIDFNDRSTCCLFGDGAGAIVFELDDASDYHFISGVQGATDIITCNGYQNKTNPFVKQDTKEERYLNMNGREVFRFAVDKICYCAEELIKKADITAADIDYFVCHQANLRILNSAAKRLGLSEEKFFSNLNHCGNTSAASIPIALDEMVRNNLLKPGMKLILSGFGAGLTYGGIYLTW